MAGGLTLVLLLYFITRLLLQRFIKGRPLLKVGILLNLYWYHIFFTGVYYLMTISSPSDSTSYYNRPQLEYFSWLEAYDSGTHFIDFVGYPFINWLHFTYEMMMVLFSWMGYWGFVYFYIFFKENIQYKHFLKGYDLINVFIFLPNMHYWTSSLGKGSIIFWGLGMATYGLSQIKSRKFALLLGLAIVYHVRPHVFLFMCIGIIVGMVTGREKVPLYQKMIVFGGCAIATFFLYNSIIGFAGLDSDNLVDSFDQFSSTRASELAGANSGIDISNYPLALKLFSFWFRPLFIDSPSVQGLVVSFENLLYLFLFSKLFNKGFLKFVAKGTSLIKTCAVVFLATSLALGETLSNMGIIIRQKSMVMYFLLFICISFMDYKKSAFLDKRNAAAEEKKIKEMAVF
ncbi:MAG TPA: hypothetical protein VHB48_10645 [Chitinophagaceae bacterium]|nr:hypothetical protein [Chitinophagaceae bacterium]